MLDTIKIIRERLSKVKDSQGSLLYDERESRAISDLLLEEVCGVTRMDRIMHPEFVLSEEQRERLMEIVGKMERGIPVQQALGYAWFYGEKFKVSPDVLIPRPETAELVDWIVEDARTLESQPAELSPLSICDIGTGSGCIAISLARVISGSKVLAIDLSAAALNIAGANASQQHVDNIQFAQIDILDYVDNLENAPLSTQDINTYQQSYQQFDIIVSNPPYVCNQEASEMSEIVLKHEPEMALFVPNDDPLLFYRAIAKFGLKRLKGNGLLYFEINAAYGKETCQLLENMGYQEVVLREDVTGKDRMVKAKRAEIK